MNAVTFHVPGKPQGKARAKTVRNKHTGNTMSYTPETDLLYENYIKDRFLNKCNGMFLERGKPVALRIVARFLPPKSTSKKRTALMLDGKELPLKKPDIDNIVKVVADALNGVAYHDDTQIVMVVAKKSILHWKDWTLLWKNIRDRKEGAAWPDRRSKAFFTFHLYRFF